MSAMNKLRLLALITAFLAGAAVAESPTRLMCATLEAMDCEPGASCLRGRPAELGAPSFMRIDLEEKTIAGPQRTTPILLIEKSEKSAQLLLQGTEVDFGWTMAVDTANGTMAATLVNREGAFVLFGTRTPL